MYYSKNKTDLERYGFTSLESIFTSKELDKTESAIDDLMKGSSWVIRCLKRELADTVNQDGFIQPELSRPALLSRKLRTGFVFEKCRAVASEIMGCKVHYLFDHAIYKMPETCTVTPWHQDQAYLGEGVSIPSLHFWIPLQDVSDFNGTLRFSHCKQQELLSHRAAFEDNPHLLKSRRVAPEKFHSVTLKKGGVSIHTNLTLHATGPNKSDQIRKVWVIHFGVRSVWQKYLLQFFRH